MRVPKAQSMIYGCNRVKDTTTSKPEYNHMCGKKRNILPTNPSKPTWKGQIKNKESWLNINSTINNNFTNIV